MTRILLVDDEALIRAGLRMILDAGEDLEVVAEAPDGGAAIEAVRRWRPDVVLMDIHMPEVDGLAATTTICEAPDAPSVIILTTFDADDHVFRALRAGASGFLLKDTPPQDLIRAVQLVAAGDSMLSPAIARRLIAHVAADARSERRQAAQSKLLLLTGREHEVLAAVASGRTNAEIADVLFMSEATVKSHVTHLFQKLQVTNRVQLAILAHHAGMLD